MIGATPGPDEWTFELPDGRQAGIGYDPDADILAFVVRTGAHSQWTWIEIVNSPRWQIQNTDITAMSILRDLLRRANAWIRRVFGGPAAPPPEDEQEFDKLLRLARDELEFVDGEIRFRDPELNG